MVRRKQDVDKARLDHDSPEDPDLYVPSRAEDRSFWWRMTYFAQKYLIVWAPLVWIVSAIGFGVITPARKADELKFKTDSAMRVLKVRIDDLKVDQDALRVSHESIERDLKVLVRFGCIDRRVTQYDKQLIGLVDAQGTCVR
jgi:hypothetical protein